MYQVARAGLRICMSRAHKRRAREVDVTLIGQGDSLVFGFSRLDVMFARRTVRLPC